MSSTRPRLLPPAYFAAGILLVLSLHWLLPLGTFAREPYSLLGWVPVALGVCLNVYLSRLFESRQTTIKPYEPSSQLVTDGPYRWSRNPMYLGMVLVLGGVTIILGTFSSLLVIPGFIAAMTSQFIGAEERMLASRFGSPYTDYVVRTRRWI
jgi:protein-S-isoprenylcysteine O-methyltransferase Ste14